MKLLQSGLLLSSVCLVTACTNTVGNNKIDEAGNLISSGISWPKPDSATLPEGVFVNTANLSKIGSGLTKKDLYHLLGRPHFSEMKGASEWNYILKFRQVDGKIKYCQYKVLFDKQKLARNFYWYPADSCPYQEPKAKAEVVVAKAPVTPKIIRKKITLNTDALFAFNEYRLNSMLPTGRRKLDVLARKLLEYNKQGSMRIAVIGHTDRIGSHDYNMQLSQNRASTVVAYLSQRGVPPATMSIAGFGEIRPVVKCSTKLSRKQQVKCLQPNRRVEIDVIVDEFEVK